MRHECRPVVCWALCLALGISSAQAALFSAKSATTGDWAEAATWTNNAVPGDGDDVEIAAAGAQVILSGSSSNLNSLTVGRTLVFTNWNSILRATTVTILTNGTVTLPAAFTNNQVSNNVYFLCTNFILSGGATIGVDSKGYGGTSQSPGSGPGGGVVWVSGGGHGGRGGYNGGQTNDIVEAPTLAGSAGASHSSAGFPGGPGGGAVRIHAAGMVTLNGTITANGGMASSAGSGAGGAIYIVCRTLAGTGGLVRAIGGDQYGGGGGGRIAVIYDTNAQAALPVPSVQFQTTPGIGSYMPPGALGTLYFPDNRFLANPFRHSGQWLVPDTTNLTAGAFLVSNGWLKLPADGFRLTVTGNLEVVGTDTNRHKLEMTNAVISCGDLFLNSARMILWGGTTSGLPSLACGGNALVTNSAALFIYSGPTNVGSSDGWGATIEAGGEIRIATNSALYLYAHPTNGGAPYVHARDFTVAWGGWINADGGGFIGRSQAKGYGPGGGSGSHQAGGGYGGHGGARNSGIYGVACGDSNAPVMPGSAGGAHTSPGYPGGSGGGTVRIRAENTITVDGSITADGNATGPSSSSGAGSGGGIYLVSRSFNGAGGLIRARGGTGVYANGGGGRVAIWRVNDTSAGVTATAVAGAAALGDFPEDGTVVWGFILPGGTLIQMW